MKKRCIVYGNCHIVDICELLQALPDFGSEYDITGVLSYQSTPPPEDHVRSCSLFIYQVGQWTIPPSFVEALPPHCTRLAFPAAGLQVLWPLLGKDPRSFKGSHDFSDTLVIKLSKQGWTREQLFEKYLETPLTEVVDLDRFWEISSARQRSLDDKVDIKIFPYIESGFRKERLFWAYNHPTHLMLLRVTQMILSALGFQEIPPQFVEVFLHKPTIGGLQIPIHPQVLEHFRIEWANSATLYHCVSDVEHGWFTFDEFMWRYISRGKPF